MEDYKTSDTVQKYEYANVNYNLLGLIVEHVSGMSYGEYIKTNIFEPLGMTHSYTSIDEAKANGLIDGYRDYFGFMIADECAYPENMTSGWMTVSAAYLISTANDMGKYLQFYLGGNTRILSDESIYTMFHDTTKVIEDYEYGYGWGISKSPDITMYQHGGNVENYTTYMILLPELGKAVVVLTNASDYFSADGMVVGLAENIGCKLSGIKTIDIDSGAYMTTHIVLDAIMLMIVAADVLSLVFLKKSFQNRKISAIRLIGFVLLHLVLPTLLLLVPNMLGSTLWVGARFAPDLFAVLVFGSSALYLSGICKIIFYFRHLRKPAANQ
jgi:CubicO group peptidase (beta-lactamase class C family)